MLKNTWYSYGFLAILLKRRNWINRSFKSGRPGRLISVTNYIRTEFLFTVRRHDLGIMLSPPLRYWHSRNPFVGIPRVAHLYSYRVSIFIFFFYSHGPCVVGGVFHAGFRIRHNNESKIKRMKRIAIFRVDGIRKFLQKQFFFLSKNSLHRHIHSVCLLIRHIYIYENLPPPRIPSIV